MATVGRPRVARAYVWLTGIVTAMIFAQGGLIGAYLYKSVPGSSALDAHGIVGTIAGFVAIVPFILALTARFPRELKLGWWTFAWALLWNVQGHIFGFGIEDER